MSSSEAIQTLPTERARRMFADDLRAGFAMTPKQIPAKYFYDALGSLLFDAICQLPWYRITRAEMALLRAYTPAMMADLTPPVHLVELGCGNGEKLAAIVEGCADLIGGVQLIDVSETALAATALRLQRLGVVVDHAHAMSYEEGLAAVARRRPSTGTLLVLCLGSNVGNFGADERQALLGRIRAALQPDDALLLGTDLIKPEADLRLAYDDPLGVTAAFNLNVLRRINDELGGTFDLTAFAHRAVWNAAGRRIEMQLVSRFPQRVRIEALGRDVAFEEGEVIWTESSYKYLLDEVRRFGVEAGFGPASQWVDEEARFAVTRFRARA